MIFDNMRTMFAEPFDGVPETSNSMKSLLDTIYYADQLRRSNGSRYTILGGIEALAKYASMVARRQQSGDKREQSAHEYQQRSRLEDLRSPNNVTRL